MSFYNIDYNPPNFSVIDPMFNLQSTVSLMKDAVHQADKEVEIDTDGTVMITADQLLSGRIIRTGLTSNTNDYPESASAIISAFKAKVKSISDRDTIQNGSSFKCQVLNDTNEWWGLYSNLAGGVRVGGQLVPGHIVDGATGILEIIVNDQASLGSGHSDQVWICVSRCSTQIADDD
jgi:hypothetical protein